MRIIPPHSVDLAPFLRLDLREAGAFFLGFLFGIPKIITQFAGVLTDSV
jgi:hypothetical protein